MGLLPYDNRKGGGQKPHQPPQKTKKFKLFQNYPNPFSHSTTIPYELAKATKVTLEVYNIIGQRVLKRKIGQQSAGKHEVTIDLTPYASGVYIYRIIADKKTSTRKMMFIK